MSVITISRRPFSRGAEVAEKVAAKLGYRCVAREVLFEAGRKFNIHDEKVLRAIHDAPSFSDHFHFGRERYVAFFQAALLGILQTDNVVYHGLAGHFFAQGVPHVLRVRVITSLDERVRLLTERERISPKNATRLIKREDQDRRKWSRHLYGIDTWDPSLYHLVLNIGDLSADDAVAIICETVGMDRFRTTPESQAKMDDLVIGAHVKAALMEVTPGIEVHAENGRLVVKLHSRESDEPDLRRRVEEIVGAVPGVQDLEIQVEHSTRHYD